MRRYLLFFLVALTLAWLVEIPIVMLILGSLHHYWPLIPALGYAALFFISLLSSVLAFFYSIGKGMSKTMNESVLR
jgi:hypothetical protein